MKLDLWTLGQSGVLIAALGSLAWAAPSVIRHHLGIVVLEHRGSTMVQRSEVETDALDLTATLNLAPFGRAIAALPDALEASATGAPDLTLKGIFASETDAASSALITTATEQGVYRLGDTIAAGLRLQGIAEDHVILAAADGIITLFFDQTETPARAAESPARRNTGINDRLRAATVVAAQTQRAGAPKTTAEYISYWRRKIRRNPQAVLDTIGLEPSDDGYRIAQEHNRGVRLAGLKAGDLVRSVNGRAVGNPDQDRDAYDQIAASGQARLEVQRDDKILTFSFPLR